MDFKSKCYEELETVRNSSSKNGVFLINKQYDLHMKKVDEEQETVKK